MPKPQPSSNEQIGLTNSASPSSHPPRHDHTSSLPSNQIPCSRPPSSQRFEETPPQPPDKSHFFLPLVNPQEALIDNRDFGRLFESSTNHDRLSQNTSSQDQGSPLPQSRASTGTAITKDDISTSPGQSLRFESRGTISVNAHSPGSASSRNRTPTQANYIRNQSLADTTSSVSIVSRQANKKDHPLPSLPDDHAVDSGKKPVFETLNNENSSDAHGGRTTKLNDANVDGTANRIMYGEKLLGSLRENPSHRDTAFLRSTREAAPSPRVSEDSQGTFKTAESSEEQTLLTTHATSPTTPKTSFFRPHDPTKGSVDRDVSPLREPSQLDTQGTENHQQYSSTVYSQAISVKSSDNWPNRANPGDDSTLQVKNRPPSPVSPQLQGFTRQGPSDPVHHDISYDFDAHNSQNSFGQGRPRSFSRPFQDPNVHDHPAFRQGDSRGPNEPPTEYLSPQLSYDEAMVPQQQATEHQLEGLGPPVGGPNLRARSHSTSRGASFFKRLSGPPRESLRPSPDVSGTQNEGFTASVTTTPPVAIKEKKTKRASLFRSLTGYKDNSAPPPNRSYGGNQHDNEFPPRQNKITVIPTKGETVAKSRGKLQRASTSGPNGLDAGKKNRFSRLGVS